MVRVGHGPEYLMGTARTDSHLLHAHNRRILRVEAVDTGMGEGPSGWLPAVKEATASLAHAVHERHDHDHAVLVQAGTHQAVAAAVALGAGCARCGASASWQVRLPAVRGTRGWCGLILSRTVLPLALTKAVNEPVQKMQGCQHRHQA
jgi:hypothetical protein